MGISPVMPTAVPTPGYLTHVPHSHLAIIFHKELQGVALRLSIPLSPLSLTPLSSEDSDLLS